MKPISVAIVVFSALLLSLTGCAAKSDQGEVAGTVTFNGEPLKTGTIRFDPADGHTATANAIITDGKYTAKMPPGEKRIAISAQKVVGKKKMYDTPQSPVVDLTEEMLPKQYNAQSDLKLTVAAGSQQKDFDLKSGK